MAGAGRGPLPSATRRACGTTCSGARASPAQPPAPTVLARANPDGHPGTGASAGKLHSGRAGGTSSPKAERERSRRANSEKRNERGPRSQSASTWLPPRSTRMRASVARERKSSCGSLQVVRVGLNTTTLPPREKVLVVRPVSLNGHAAAPPVRAQAPRGWGCRGRWWTQPSADVCGPAPPAGSCLPARF